MINANKKRIIKDYDQLSSDIKEQIKLGYPNGYSENLITFTNKEGKIVSALPFETDDIYYLVRMTISEAIDIISDDEDFDDEGNLRVEMKEEYEGKYPEIDLAEEGLGGADDDDEVDDVADEPYDEDEDDED